MKIMTKWDFKKLKFKDKIYKISDKWMCKWYSFVSVMPSCENYFIFSAGEDLQWVHISWRQPNTFEIWEWYKWKYDSNFVWIRLIEKLNRRLSAVKSAYLKNDI